MSRFAWTVSGIAQETKLWVPMKEFPDWITGRGTPHPICGWHLLWTGALAWIKRRKWAKDQHSSLLSSWLRVQCDQSPQGDCHHDRSHSHTVSQIQTFPSATTRKSHHCAAGMTPPIREATVKKMQCWCGDLKGALQMSGFSGLTKMLKRCWPSTTHLSQTKSNSTGKEEVLSRACGPPWSAICTQVAQRD